MPRVAATLVALALVAGAATATGVAARTLRANGGESWAMQAAPWQPRADFGFAVVDLPGTGDQALVVAGGSTCWNSALGDVFHAQPNGTDWQEVSSQFPKRRSHDMVYTADDKLIVTGGLDEVSHYINNVLVSSDVGMSWQETLRTAPYQARYAHRTVALSDGSVLLCGGEAGSTHVLNDCWRSTDSGSSWTAQTTAAEWTPRHDHAMAVGPKDAVFIAGGRSRSGSSSRYTNEVWVSGDKGATWTQLPAPAWSPRQGLGMVVSGTDLIVMGGYSSSFQQTYFTDMWVSIDGGESWTKDDRELPQGITNFGSGATKDGTIVVVGGEITIFGGGCQDKVYTTSL